VLFTQDEGFAHAVQGEVKRCLAKGYAGPAARASWETHGAIILVDELADAAPLVNSAAPEHVQIAAVDADEIALHIRHAGAIFLGAHTPEALGDYVAGPSHVLPTMRGARYASGLSTLTFMKRTTLIGAGPEGMAAIGGIAARLADAEGLPAHARSLRLRLAKHD
jgi:histidinol dehydrogenase